MLTGYNRVQGPTFNSLTSDSPSVVSHVGENIIQTSLQQVGRGG